MKNKKNSWLWQAFLITFILALVFGSISSTVVANLNIVFAIIILIVFIAIGVIFDAIGMAVVSADEAPFHAKAAKKHIGAKESIMLVRNASTVSNICNDVIGDICGVISGSIGALLTPSISNILNMDVILVGLVVGALIASITVGTKAIGKNIALKKCTEIIYFAGSIVHLVHPIKK